MATITSGAAGPWSSPSTWTGGVVPGSADTVNINHVVTLDQNVTVTNLTQNANAGVLQITGSTPRTLTVTTLLRTAVGSTNSDFIEFTALYSATGSVITVDTITIGAHTGSSMLSVIGFIAGATGTVSISVNTFNGDTNNSGNEPALINLNTTAATGVTLSLNYTTFSYSQLVYNGGTAQYLTITTTSNTVWTVLQNVNMIAMGTLFVGTVTFNGNMTTPNFANAYLLTMNSPTSLPVTNQPAPIPTVIINGNVTVNALGHVANFNSRAYVYVYGDVLGTYTGPGFALQTPLTLEVHGDVITSATTGATTTPLISAVTSFNTAPAVSPTIRVWGDIISNGTASAISTNNVPVIIGEPNSGNTYTIGQYSSGSAITGRIIYTEGNNFVMAYQSDSAYPAWTGSVVNLKAEGLGPSVSNTRKGVVYPTGVEGELEIPSPNAVRAGVDVDGTVGTALLDNHDLANITGGQIATLSE